MGLLMVGGGSIRGLLVPHVRPREVESLVENAM